MLTLTLHIRLGSIAIPHNGEGRPVKGVHGRAVGEEPVLDISYDKMVRFPLLAK